MSKALPNKTPTHTTKKGAAKVPKPRPVVPASRHRAEQVNSADALVRAMTASAPELSASDILALQRTAGNRAVKQILAASVQRQGHRPLTIQAKLAVGTANDSYEREADRVAATVMQTSESSAIHLQRKLSPEEDDDETIQRKPSSITPLIQRQAFPETEDEEEDLIQRHATSGTASIEPTLEPSIARARGGGRPLPRDVRNRMEQSFDADFSDVRVHADSESDSLNLSLHSRAFTTGHDLFFKGGEYNPASKRGQELIAHELTHVVQQRGGRSRNPGLSVTRAPGNVLQRNAIESVQGDRELWKALSPIAKAGAVVLAPIAGALGGGPRAVDAFYRTLAGDNPGTARALLSGFATTVLSPLSLAYGAVTGLLAGLAFGIGNPLYSAGKRFLRFLVWALTGLVDGARRLWRGIKERASRAWRVTKEVASRAWRGTKEFAGWAWRGTKELASRAWRGTKELAGWAWRGTKELASRAWRGTKEVAGWAWRGISEGASRAWKWVGTEVDELRGIYEVDTTGKYGNLPEGTRRYNYNQTTMSDVTNYAMLVAGAGSSAGAVVTQYSSLIHWGQNLIEDKVPLLGVSGKAISGLGVASGALGTIASLADAKQGYAEWKDSARTEEQRRLGAGRALSGVASATQQSATTAFHIGNLAQTGVAAGAQIAAGGAAIATGAVDILRGGYGAFKAHQNIARLRDLQVSYHSSPRLQTPAGAEIVKAAKQGASTQEGRRSTAIVTGLKGALTVAGGVMLAASLATPIGWALLGAGALIGGLYALKKTFWDKRNRKEEVAMRELKVTKTEREDWKKAVAKIEKDTGWRSEARKAQLEALGPEPLERKLKQFGFKDKGHFYANYINYMARHLYTEGVNGKNRFNDEALEAIADLRQRRSLSRDWLRREQKLGHQVSRADLNKMTYKETAQAFQGEGITFYMIGNLYPEVEELLQGIGLRFDWTKDPAQPTPDKIGKALDE